MSRSKSAHKAEIVLPKSLTDLLPERKAAAIRNALRVAMAENTGFAFSEVLEAARQANWSAIELEKLAAYVEFYSGRSEAAYQRIISLGLAKQDYPLFITACIYCYLFDRIEESYKLLKQFEPANADNLDRGEFLAHAGYIVFSAGGSIDEALAYFDEAIDEGVVTKSLAINAYLPYFEAGKHEKVDYLRQQIHERYATDPEALFALACIEMARGYYPEGFRLGESRYEMPETRRSINLTLLYKPRWKGGSLVGKTLLVHGEQGLGDMVMMARYLPLLVAREAKIIVDCRPEAITLLQHNYPECLFFAGDHGKPINHNFDIWIGVMSLPFHFNTTADSVPCKQGYLQVPLDQKSYWRERVFELTPNKNALKIGLAWSGNPSHRADKRRSIPYESLFAHVRDFPDIHFYSLQTSVPPMCPTNLINTSDEMVTLADTAALISEMDLVITVDTSVVHIAGALGKPTWLLLPYRYEWRWNLVGEGNNWYGSVRVFRQSIHGDWKGLLQDIFGSRLKELADNWHEAN